MEKRKRPSKQAMDNFARTLAPYIAEILAQEKREEAIEANSLKTGSRKNEE
ncbi:hypothetical protein [Fictibacillus sp. 26RED30]|uniref:hypothetical protein n=1 Tax=Fictibacillus sp. 26RED30 TaxID=2745877 RepID=UPI0018CEB983|nr:hypothetical protein [Fictibacillus sp. 26RED30]MBH0159860.1 hypothetical protein [Fictibacillus sp. 26RED30]